MPSENYLRVPLKKLLRIDKINISSGFKAAHSISTGNPREKYFLPLVLTAGEEEELLGMEEEEEVVEAVVVGQACVRPSFTVSGFRVVSLRTVSALKKKKKTCCLYS